MAPFSVLIVDENPTFIEILTRFLSEEHAGHVTVVGTTTRMEDADLLARAKAPQVIIHDLWLPGLRGIPSIQSLRGNFPNVSIIALTLLDSASHRKMALEAGADEVIHKGQLFFEIMRVIRKATNRRSRERSADTHKGRMAQSVTATSD